MARSQTRRLFDILIDGMWHINGELAQKISSSKFGFCMRLTGRIHDLRQLGFDIRCEAIDRRRGVFKYRMFTPRVEIDVDKMMRMLPKYPSHLMKNKDSITFRIRGQQNLFKIDDVSIEEITRKEADYSELRLNGKV